MVRQKLDVYYTFKVTGQDPLRIDCYKWTEFDDVPTDTYKIMPHNKGPLGGCSCPAWTSNCKHMKCVDEAIADGKINELWKWRWSEREGWQLQQDGLTEEEMAARLLDGGDSGGNG